MAWSQEPATTELYESSRYNHHLEIKYYDHDELGIETNEEIQEFVSWSFKDKKDGGYYDSDVLKVEEIPNFLVKGDWRLITRTENKRSYIRKLRLNGKIPDRTLIYYRSIDGNTDIREYFVVENYTEVPTFINYYFVTDNDEYESIDGVYTGTMKDVYRILQGEPKWKFLKFHNKAIFRRIVV